MKTSVLIPCTPEHFIYLDRVIKSLVECDEVVIVLGSFRDVPFAYRQYFKSVYTKNIKLIEWEYPIYTGAACSIGERECSNDIIMIQAADDLCHARRAEIVKKYFKSHDIVSLNHSYYGLDMMEHYGINALRNRFDYDNIKVYQPHQIADHIKERPLDVYGQFCDCHVAAGTLCYRRDIVGKFKWSNKKHGQDTITCKRIMHKFKKSIIIDAPLYYYFK